MIFDNIKNKELYYKLGDGFKLGLEFIEKCKKDGAQVGEYELDGRRVYAMVQEYDTKEEAAFESHDNYIDIQYILKGSEMMYWAMRYDCSEMVPYNAEKDVSFYEEKSDALGFLVNEDEFMVFFPDDVHKPGMKVKESRPIKKVLIKIHI